jgi:hypothetical protein
VQLKYCDWCNKSITRCLAKINLSKTGKYFCSNTCRHLGHRKQTRYQCYICNKTIYKTPLQVSALKHKKPTCSRVCKDQFASITNTKEHNFETITCTYCNQTVKRHKWLYQQLFEQKTPYRFCSRVCSTKWRQQPGNFFLFIYPKKEAILKYSSQLLKDFISVTKNKKEINYEEFGMGDRFKQKARNKAINR